MRRRSLLFVLILALACTRADPYALASRAYNADALAYVQAGNKIRDARAAGAVTDAQWQRFADDQVAVRAVDARTYADLEAWRLTGNEPPSYAANAQALRFAQARVLALAAEVSR